MLLSNQDDEEDEADDKEIKIFTITDIKTNQSKLPWQKSKETKVKYTSKPKNELLEQKDITPKEVAKMRKAKAQSDGNNHSGWKCCLF